MLSRFEICCSAFIGVLFLGTSARGQSLGSTEVFVTSAGQSKGMSLYSTGFSGSALAQPALDYAVFATELIAFLTKEVVADSPGEFDGSLLGSRLTRTMPDSTTPDIRSQFGSHCLMIVRRLGTGLPTAGGAPSLLSPEPSTLGYVARGAAAGFALRQIWSAFQNDVEGNRAGVSLNPKVSARRVGVNLTLHW